MDIKYTLTELKDLPTLAQGQTCNLKLEVGNRRVWLSRCTIEDGEPYNNKVTVERLDNGTWIKDQQYQAN